MEGKRSDVVFQMEIEDLGDQNSSSHQIVFTEPDPAAHRIIFTEPDHLPVANQQTKANEQTKCCIIS